MMSEDAAGWCEAIQDELNSLKKTETWNFVEKPESRDVIGCKWVFKVKSTPGNPNIRRKARLVAKGYSQKAGIHYNETFSPVVHYDSVRMLLAVAAVENLEILQFDVKTAFLNGDLEEEIFMELPKGLKVAKESLVCHLKKSLYGLKQAPRAWNIKFTSFLQSCNFVASKADPCVFTGCVDEKKVVLLLYVDDRLFLSSCKQSLEKVLNMLEETFEVTRGNGEYYVGLEIRRDRRNKKMYINQEAYALKIKKKFNMADANPISPSKHRCPVVIHSTAFTCSTDQRRSMDVY